MNAVGIATISRVRTDSLRDVLLLSPPGFVLDCRCARSIRSRSGACAAQLRLCVYGYVVMPNHVHLLLSEPPQGTLADAIKSLKQGVSRRLIGRAEHFWQKRYYDFNVRNERQFVEKLRYIHRNPVDARLVRSPGRLGVRFRQWATGCAGRVEIECEWTARERERKAGRLCPAVELSRGVAPH